MGSNPRSIIEVLQSHAASNPEKTAFRHLEWGVGDEIDESTLTYRQLDENARAAAAVLQARVGIGEPAVLVYPSGLDYVTAFFACLYAGVVAVPAYPPFTSAMRRRLASAIADSGAKHILTNRLVRDLARTNADLRAGFEGAELLATDTSELRGAESSSLSEPEEDGLTFLQYTSGSTAEPKGVCLTHRSLLHNIDRIQETFETTSETKGVFWLPLYHDMGLIGGLLHTVYKGAGTVLFSPLDFIRRPFRWLQLISDRRLSMSGGPNFAYDLCVKKVTDDEVRKLDLSCWKVAVNGAEPIRYCTLLQFTAKFAPAGFRQEAFYPCYGLAESTLIVSGARKGTLPTARRFNNAALRRNDVIIEQDEQHGSIRVGCGLVVGDTDVAIVDPETREKCPEDRVGEVWVKSKSVAQGYFGQDEESAAVFRAFTRDEDGPYLRTGDLGFLFDGELFVTCRIKDLIIIRGKNYYPSDIEKIIEVNRTSKYAGTTAVFSIEEDGEEKLVVLQEIRRGANEEESAQIVETIKKKLMIGFKLKLHDIVLVRAGSILRTSSGKLCRRANRREYLNGTLERL